MSSLFLVRKNIIRTLLISYYPNPNPNPNPNLIEFNKNYSGIKTLTIVPHALSIVSNATLLGLCNPSSNPNEYPKRKGLKKGLHKPNMVGFDTDSKAHVNIITFIQTRT